MKLAILAGGLGTRLREETEFKPKPMVEIGGMPIIWHIMSGYASYGVTNFVVCTGYKGEIIRNYFRNLDSNTSNFTINYKPDKKISIHNSFKEKDWEVTLVDTGPKTNTGGRIHLAKEFLDNETFACTYGDGLSNVNIKSLIDFHKAHKRIATMTIVRPNSRFGVVSQDNGLVTEFEEKPISKAWINAGFFIFEPEIFNYMDSDCVLESNVLVNLTDDSQLMAFEHEGFWQAMDTYRESIQLNELWENGNAPWKTW